MMLLNMNSKHVIVRERVHEILINQSTRRDNPGDFSIMHETARFDLFRRIIWELFSNRHIAIVILDEDLQISIKLEEGKSRLSYVSGSATKRVSEIEKVPLRPDPHSSFFEQL